MLRKKEGRRTISNLLVVDIKKIYSKLLLDPLLALSGRTGVEGGVFSRERGYYTDPEGPESEKGQY